MTVQSRYCVMTGPTLHFNNGSVMISEVRKVKVENTDMVMIERDVVATDVVLFVCFVFVCWTGQRPARLGI